MKRALDFPRVYLFRPFTDMRKQINGLSMIVQNAMHLDPFGNALFVFVNKRRDLMKCLYWNSSGFAMWVMRLEQEKFIWPKKIPDDVISVSPQEMDWLLSGYDIWKMKRHKTLRLTASG